MSATQLTPCASGKPEREALTLKEAAELGYGCERLLREMICTGRLKECVLRVGRRGVRLLRVELIEELRRGRN